MAAERLRVLHAPTVVGGNPPALARAEREVGLDSWAVNLGPNNFSYRTDDMLWDGTGSSILCELRRWEFLLRAALSYDLVHFNFGRTFFNLRGPDPRRPDKGTLSARAVARRARHAYVSALEQKDVPALKLAGKAIAVTFQGDDARQADRCRDLFEIHAADEVEDGYYTVETDNLKRQRIDRFDEHADLIYSVNPDLLHVLPGRARFIPYASVDPQAWEPRYPRERESPLRVAHAPTHRGLKGSRFIVDAVRALQEEGLEFEFDLIEGLPHAEAMRRFQRADLLIDQLLLGWYGALAVELMALGKPVICFVREGDLRFIPAQMRDDLPIIHATPKSVADVLRTWLTDRRKDLPARGRASREYVERWHDPRRIAQRLAADYREVT